MDDLTEKQQQIVNGLRQRYKVHDVVFHRSLVRAKNEVELFDILDTMPTDFPILWDKDQRRWTRATDLFQS